MKISIFLLVLLSSGMALAHEMSGPDGGHIAHAHPPNRVPPSSDTSPSVRVRLEGDGTPVNINDVVYFLADGITELAIMTKEDFLALLEHLSNSSEYDPYPYDDHIDPFRNEGHFLPFP